MKRILVLCLLALNVVSIRLFAEEQTLPPCIQDSYDSEKTVGAWGIGISSDRREASILSIRDAAESLARRFHVDSKEIEKNAQTVCRSMSMNEKNEYVTYISISVSKKELYEIIKKSNVIQ